MGDRDHVFDFNGLTILATDPNREAPSTITTLSDPFEDADALKVKAERCRRLAAGISDRQASEVLSGMARNYQDAADRLEPKA